MKHVVPSSKNKAEIEMGLFTTFASRRNWIAQFKPTTTDIVAEYKQLGSYCGDMVFHYFCYLSVQVASHLDPFSCVKPLKVLLQIIQEFSRMEPLAPNDIVGSFKKLIPLIKKHMVATKPDVVKELAAKYNDGNVMEMGSLSRCCSSNQCS